VSEQPGLHFTRHAEQMLAERNIERQWIENTIRNPEAIEPDPTRPGVFSAFRSIPERGGRVLRVVYAAAGTTVRIITAYFDRTRRR
jgi:hypothetical protein